MTRPKWISTRNMSREEWLERRRDGIGGSDAGAIMGENPWASPLSVYADKRGLVPDKALTEAMRQGIELESVVARRFSQATGQKVRRCPRMYFHAEWPFMLANIDRQVLGNGGFEGLECKTTSPFNASDFDGGEIPRSYYWQCQHYMAVTGAKRWHLAVMVLSQGFYIFEIPRNCADIQRLIDAERDFWENHLLAGVPPQPSGLDGDDAIIARMAAPEAENGGGPADFSDMVPSLDELSRLREEKSRIEKDIRATEQWVRQRLNGREAARAGQWIISHRTQPYTHLDTSRLKANRPEIYRQYLKSATRKVLKIRYEGLN